MTCNHTDLPPIQKMTCVICGLCHVVLYHGIMNEEDQKRRDEYNKIPLQFRLENEAALIGKLCLGPLED